MIGEKFQRGLHVWENLHLMARIEKYLKGPLAQLVRFICGIAGVVQRVLQDASAQLADTVAQRRVPFNQHAADRAEGLDGKFAQARRMHAQPVAQGGLCALDGRRGFPEGVVQVEGDQANAHVSVSCLRLARGCA